MNAVAILLSALLCSQTPQDSEANRLRMEAEKLRADHAVALRQLEVLAAQIKELNDKLAKAQKKPPVVGSGSSDALEDLLDRDRKALQEKLKSQAQALTAPAPVVAAPGVRSLP